MVSGLAAALAAGALPARGAEPRGPAYGANKITSKIETQGGEPDVDDYVSSLVTGETLTVSLSVGKKSDLVPDLALVAPDGSVLTAPALPVRVKKNGKKLSLQFDVPQTGPWTVRVSGTGGTQGEYTVGFKQKGPAATKLEGLTLGGAAPLTADHEIPGIDGALLDATVAWTKTSAEVRATDLLDPAGDPVLTLARAPAVDGAVTKGRKLTLKKVALHEGDGNYVLRLAADAEAEYSLTYVVKPQARPKGKQKLLDPEPRLPTIATAVRGIPDAVVRLSGSGFVSGARVFFGDAEGANVTVDPAGAFLDVTVPDGEEGSTVDLAVQNPDGQASVRADAFFYVPPPTVTDLTDPLGAQVRGGSTAGGQVLRLHGTNLYNSHSVRLGANGAVILRAIGTTQLELRTPVAVASTVNVVLTDEFGRVVVAPFQYSYKTPPVFALNPYSPTVAGTGGTTAITVTGSNFEDLDVVLFDGAEVARVPGGPTSFTFTPPARAAGSYSVQIRDRVGATVTGPNLELKGPPTITSTQAIAGTFAGTRDVPFAGGTTIQVDGTNFRATDTVTLGGAAVTPAGLTSTRFTFVVPSSTTAGGVNLEITDLAGQSATLVDAVRYLGFLDSTASRTPGGSSTDNFGALRAALGDLDNDGADDDVVIVSEKSAPGTRTEFTRILFESSGALSDATASYFPGAYSDPNGIDDWRARAVAIGDLDGSSGDEIVIAGAPTSVYYSYTYYYYNDARIFTNDGSGGFSFSYDSPVIATTTLYAYDPKVYSSYQVYRSSVPLRGFAPVEAMALGDLDGDSDLDLVMATSNFRTGYFNVYPNYITWTPGNYTTSYAYYSYYGSYYYTAGTRVLMNEISSGNGMLDLTIPRVPHGGTIPSFSPAFVGRDVALGDLDNDNDLDIVTIWDDPTTTAPYGLYYGAGKDSARESTKVLTNDGKGFFGDATSTWIPTGSQPEFWQGHRLALADLDGDSDLDLVLLHNGPLDSYTGGTTFTRSALRVLRNGGSSFTDVTATAIPPVPLAGTQNDNLRGESLAVQDVDGDGRLDIVVGTTEALATSGGGAARRTRMLLNQGNLVFGLAEGFLPAVTTDSGEASDLLLGDLDGDGGVSLFLFTPVAPNTSPASEFLRSLDWTK